MGEHIDSSFPVAPGRRRAFLCTGTGEAPPSAQAGYGGQEEVDREHGCRKGESRDRESGVGGAASEVAAGGATCMLLMWSAASRASVARRRRSTSCRGHRSASGLLGQHLAVVLLRRLPMAVVHSLRVPCAVEVRARQLCTLAAFFLGALSGVPCRHRADGLGVRPAIAGGCYGYGSLHAQSLGKDDTHFSLESEGISILPPDGVLVHGPRHERTLPVQSLVDTVLPH